MHFEGYGSDMAMKLGKLGLDEQFTPSLNIKRY